jgi:pyridoxal 5'-phosphate synthase pdxT subunit
VNRNHFGRQIESFQATLDLPFLRDTVADEKDFDTSRVPFKAIFIRAPIVEKILPNLNGVQEGETQIDGTIVAPSRALAVGVDEKLKGAPVEVLARLPGRTAAISDGRKEKLDAEAGDIVAVRQANVFGTSFHPELTGDPRIHVWWLEQVVKTFDSSLRA